MYVGEFKWIERHLGISGIRRQLFSNVNMTVNTKLIHINVVVLLLHTYGFIKFKGFYKTTKSMNLVNYDTSRCNIHLGLTKLE